MNKANLGCGLCTPEGWINVDGSWNARLARRAGFIRRLGAALGLVDESKSRTPWSPNILGHDLRTPLPFAANHCDVIYSSHLLEHLYHAEAQVLLRECFRVMKPGGIIRMVVPDLKAMVAEYFHDVNSETTRRVQVVPNANRAMRLNRRLGFRSEAPPGGSVAERAYRALNDFHTHKWMYDSEALAIELVAAGFGEVEEVGFRKSRIPDIHEVEQEGRVLNGEGVCVEGVKPPVTSET